MRRTARVQTAAATLSGNSLRQTVHTRRASVHQAAKLVTALIRVAMVTAGLAESNDSLPPGLWLTSPAGDCQEPGSAPETFSTPCTIIALLSLQLVVWRAAVGVVHAGRNSLPVCARWETIQSAVWRTSHGETTALFTWIVCTMPHQVQPTTTAICFWFTLVSCCFRAVD